MSLSLSLTLRGIRERGLENVFQRFYSFYQAQVTDGVDPQQRGRVKVRPHSLGYNEAFSFADTYSPFASDDAGFFFPPYEKDEVYVTFDHGDISSPMVMGGFWKTRGQKGPADSSVPAEFVATETTEDGAKVGVAPRVRGIKVKAGSALIFDETEDAVMVEMWTGESQGVGKRSTKNHRVRLDSTKDAGQVVVATFGDANPNAQAASDDDTPAVRDKKELEGRLRHQILMRDTADDRFVHVKTIGKDDQQKFLSFLLSDTQERIVVTSSDQHYILIDDKNDNITIETLGKFKTIWDEQGKQILSSTPGGQKFTMGDTGAFNQLETSKKQILKQNATGTTIDEPLGALTINATTASVHTYKAALTHTITAAWTATASLFDLTTTGVINLTGTIFTFMGASFAFTGAAFTYTGANMTVASPSVILGMGNILPLLNTNALAKYNGHTHIVVGVSPGIALPTGAVMVPGGDTTVATVAG